jgi:hypothetical protein
VREALSANLKDLVTKDYLDAQLREETGKLDVRLTRLETDITWLI